MAIRGESLDYLIDRDHKLTIADVASRGLEGKFINGKAEDVVTNNHSMNGTYWTRATVRITSEINKPYVIELFDFQIDSLELYLPMPDGSYRIHRAGYLYPFSHKDFKHKNFVFSFPYEQGVTKTIYMKITASRPVSFIGVVRSYQRFNEYATSEYFYLALYYGILIAMVLYNIFLLFAFKDKTYLFYVLYVISIAIFSLSKDGLGFEFLWDNYPSLNNYIPQIANYMVTVFALLYARSFLNTALHQPAIDKGILLLLGARTVIFAISFTYPSLTYNNYINLIPLFYIYAAGIISWIGGYKMARFYVLAFSLFFTGYLISFFQLLGFFRVSVYTVYSINFGVLAEMILLSMGLADRIRMLTMEKEKAQREIVVQLQENQLLKDNLNKELEEKVKERSQELDNFVYRSSHDIRGPLKSIIGISSIGLKDFSDPRAYAYFNHILKSSKKLDNIVAHLLSVTTIKEAKLNPTKIDLEKMIGQIAGHLRKQEEDKKVNIHLKVRQEHDFFADEKLLHSIVSHIMNFFLSRHKQNDEYLLKIIAEVNKHDTLLEFKDSGLNMDQASQSKVFDIFYKASPGSSETEAGLYMARLYTEKLGGTFRIASEPGTGTSFILRFRNRATAA